MSEPSEPSQRARRRRRAAGHGRRAGRPPVGMARVPQPGEDGDDENQGVGGMVEQPAKVMRIGTMIKQLLEEVRAAPLDEAVAQPAARDPRELHQGAGGRPRPRAARRAAPAEPAVHRGRHAVRRRAADRPGAARRLAGRAVPRHPDGAVRPADGGARAAGADAPRPAAGYAAAGAGRAGGHGPGHRPVPVALRTGASASASVGLRRYPRGVGPPVTTGEHRDDAAGGSRRRVGSDVPGPRSWQRAFDDLGAGLAAASAVGLPRLAGHQAALPALGARPAVDQHQHGRHRHGHGHPLRGAVRRADRHVPALRRHGPADLELHQRLHPRGQRGLHRERGPDPVPARADQPARLPAGVAADAVLRPQPRDLGSC